VPGWRGVEVIDVDLPGWGSARRTWDVIIDAEAVVSNRALRARAEQERWRAAMAVALREVDVLAVATVPFFPPRLEAAVRRGYLALTSPVNLAGFPALALPVPTGQRLPASLQLIGGPNMEALLLATGAMIEAAV